MDYPLMWVLIAILAAVLVAGLLMIRRDTEHYKRDRLMHDIGRREDRNHGEDERLYLEEW
ncbi:hypothetical protein ACFP47_10305 [Nesterenkonia lacusekhoensis]|uniref:Uncharacterized protein n=1 Tax=Nesterenkonia lacusekhoensis TaxID=150832 RepID=A0ABS4T544_9MICC|nr:hypothetical protein [Nesterenkonia lacusekhoensis]MBP2319593.1 hypothetical protein [Nesterenkonia lacusekhoensis]